MILIRLVEVLTWLLQWVPYPVLRALAWPLGRIAWAVAASRRRVALTNLALCFPEWSEDQRRRVGKAHFHAFVTTLLTQGLTWFASRARLRARVVLYGLEHWRAVQDRPVILLAPHFMGLDIVGVRLSVDFPILSMYQKHKDARVDEMIRARRMRFRSGQLFSRQEGLRPVLRALKAPKAFYYLPDLDLGARDSVFVPFFGVPAATVPALARLARLTGACVVPCVGRERADGLGLEARFYPAWTDFPTADVMADTTRMNAFIEDRVRETPAQYLWTHKRFKTRPPGMGDVYGRDTR